MSLWTTCNEDNLKGNLVTTLPNLDFELIPNLQIQIPTTHTGFKIGETLSLYAFTFIGTCQNMSEK